MTTPHYVACPNCGATRDVSGRYTSPRNQELDRSWWADEHLSGNCGAERFNQLKGQLIAVTGSPGLTSFHDGRVHMTLSEWERLITGIASSQAVLDEARKLCAGVEYKIPGKHETWGGYHEGRSALADEIEQIPDQAQSPPAAMPERISAVLNRAADEPGPLPVGPCGEEDGRVAEVVHDAAPAPGERHG